MGLLILWGSIFIIQFLLSYGTAYRLTKRGSDNGVALFAWLFILLLASTIPGLGICLWLMFRDDYR